MKYCLLICIVVVAIYQTHAQDCGGKYRWDNKILIDAGGLKLLNTGSRSATVHQLINITRPGNSQLGKQRAVAEQRKVHITAYLVGLGREADQDYHLILVSANNRDSMIAEIPSPDCYKVKGFPLLVNKYTAARKEINEKVDQNPGAIAFLGERKKVQITGVVFFDKIAHGKGHAPNGIELHPVLDIKVF